MSKNLEEYDEVNPPNEREQDPPSELDEEVEEVEEDADGEEDGEAESDGEVEKDGEVESDAEVENEAETEGLNEKAVKDTYPKYHIVIEDDDEEETKEEKVVNIPSTSLTIVSPASTSHPKITAPSLPDLETTIKVLIDEDELGLVKVLHSRLHGKMVVTHSIGNIEGYIKDPENETWTFVEGWYLKEQLYPTLSKIIEECLALDTIHTTQLKKIKKRVGSLKVIDRLWGYLQHRLYDSKFITSHSLGGDVGGGVLAPQPIRKEVVTPPKGKNRSTDTLTSIDQFIEECLTKRTGERAKYKDVLERYRHYYSNENKSIGRNKLLMLLLDRGRFEKAKVGGEIYIFDVAMT